MQRGIYTIALSESSVEGGLVYRGATDPALNRSVRAAAQPPPAEGAAPEPQRLLRNFLRQAQWEEGLAVVLMPTDQVSLRHLQFGFPDPKKIRQVLPLELQSELLEEVEHYAYDAEIRAGTEGGAEVLVYLAEQDALQAAVTALQEHGISPQRFTFSAQALVQANAPAQGIHFCVYVGSEESFVAMALDGRLHALTTLSPHPGEVLAQANGTAPQDWLAALFRADAEQEGQVATRDRLRTSLEGVLEEVNRFVRIHGAGQDYGVSLHGVFGGLFSWPGGTSSLTLNFPQGAWPVPRRTHLGVLEDVLADPTSFPTTRGVNLHRRVGTWQAVVRGLRAPLIVAGVLVLVLAGLLGTAYVLRAGALDARLKAVEAELQRTLGVRPPVTTVAVNAAMSRLQEQLQRLRRERAAVENLERYSYNTLRLFTDLSKAVKEQQGVTVEALTFNAERFSLTGVTPSYEEGERLRARVAELPQFQGRTVKVTHSNVGQVIRYKLTADKEK